MEMVRVHVERKYTARIGLQRTGHGTLVLSFKFEVDS